MEPFDLPLPIHMEEPYCDDPATRISGCSSISAYTSIEADTVTLPLTNDLSLVPYAVFRQARYSRTQGEVCIAEAAVLVMLQSAGILSSWFGSLAEWRKVQFPVFHDEIPRTMQSCLLR